MASDGHQVDPEALIKRLTSNIADLTLRNHMLELALEESQRQIVQTPRDHEHA